MMIHNDPLPTIIQGSYLLEELVSFSCDEAGFELDDPTPLQCILEEGAMVWNGSLPNCIGKNHINTLGGNYVESGA